MYRAESFGCLKCSTQTKVVMTPVPCTGSNGPMVMTGTYELRATVYKVYHLSPKMSASCVLAAFRVASHAGMSSMQEAMVCAVSNILKVVIRCHCTFCYVQSLAHKQNIVA